MLKPVKALCPLILLALAACASDSPSATADSAFEEEGPYSVIREDSDQFVYFFPEELDAEADWPALVWFNGASGYTEDYNYNGLLGSVASWGFVVIGGKAPGMGPPEADQRTELLRRNGGSNDALFGQVDEDRIALAGHSLGGFQTTAGSDQYQVAVPIQGAGVPTMTEAAPSLFMTSEADETVDDSTVITAYERAINNAWLANHDSADHEDPRGDGGVYREPMIAFLRWQLHDDPNGALWFTGASCILCEKPSWSFDSQ